MSDAPKLVPLIDLLRRVPQSAVYRWTDADGLRASHTSPVGRYCHEAADRIAALEAENASNLRLLDEARADAEANRRDAERYRWLRAQSAGDTFWIARGVVGSLSQWNGEPADASIDTAMKEPCRG